MKILSGSTNRVMTDLEIICNGREVLNGKTGRGKINGKPVFSITHCC
jgi:hypothetical protein